MPVLECHNQAVVYGTVMLFSFMPARLSIFKSQAKKFAHPCSTRRVQLQILCVCVCVSEK